MKWHLVISILMLVSLLHGCAQETSKASPSLEPLETPSEVPFVTSLPKSADATPTKGPDQAPSSDDPEPEEGGVYRFMVGGKITEPRLLKRGAFDNERFIGQRGPGGSVVAEMVIDIDGTVRDVILLHGVSPEIDEAFLKAVNEYLFEPATLDGKPVPVKYILVLRIEVF